MSSPHETIYARPAPDYKFEDPNRTWRLTNRPQRIRLNPRPKVCTKFVFFVEVQSNFFL